MEERDERVDDWVYDLLRGLEKAYEEMVKFKKYKGTCLVVTKNGKIVRIPPDEIPPTAEYRIGRDELDEP